MFKNTKPKTILACLLCHVMFTTPHKYWQVLGLLNGIYIIDMWAGRIKLTSEHCLTETDQKSGHAVAKSG